MEKGQRATGDRLRFDLYLTDAFNSAVFGPVRETVEDDRFVMHKPAPVHTNDRQSAFRFPKR